MEKYLGVKIIHAKPMTRQEYNNFRGWVLPEDENGADNGYLVKYLDGGKSNTPQYQGYVSWSPKEVFEKAYRPINNLTFGLAIEALKQGKKVARAGWNGKGMWLKLAKQSESGNPAGHIPVIDLQKDGLWAALPTICMKTATNELLPGWLASQTDILAEDWEVVE